MDDCGEEDGLGRLARSTSVNRPTWPLAVALKERSSHYKYSSHPISIIMSTHIPFFHFRPIAHHWHISIQ